MFWLRFFYDKHNEEGNVSELIAIGYRNFNKDTGFHLKDTPIE